MESGSSPLARGLHQPDGRYRGHGRIIPARAGFTRGFDTRPGCLTDHPRSRGVYAPRDHDASDGARIIPARAGFTSAFAKAASNPADHPRSRGVYLSPLPMPQAYAGSSPLARGLPPVGPADDNEARIIPARAGFTYYFLFIPTFYQDHPRSRGVYK